MFVEIDVTTRGVGITVGTCAVDGGVQRVVRGADGELGEAVVITEKFGVLSEVSSDLCK